MNVIDEVVEEPVGGAHRDPRRAADLLKEAIVRRPVGNTGARRTNWLR